MMKSSVFLFTALVIAVSAQGTGPYRPANYSADAGLPRHTIYKPLDTPANVKLPVLIWGEGGCIGIGTMFPLFLTEIASHGIFVIASGPPNKEAGTTTSAWMKEAIEYITKNAGMGAYANVDATRIAAAGQSCGGLEAYDMANDTRVSAIGIFNSGYLSASQADKITKPIFYFLGGSSDIAYANGEKDYTLLPEGTPSWKGNLDVGHMGTYTQPNGGKFGLAATRFFGFVLRGNATAAAFFTGGGAESEGWAAAKKSLENIKVVPL